MILLQSQPFGRRDPWAVVHHTAAASTLRAVCTVLHQLIQLSLSGARPRVNFSSSSRSEAAHLQGMTPGRWPMRLTVLPTSKSRKSAVPLNRLAKPESNQEFAKAEAFAEKGPPASV